ncbi:MAG: aminodeoxychorismate synthase component I, partial [Actinomycetota bacterium]|nr:aminodeoxychorismate synthase component I [Actinomycetota bacterium]
MLRRLAARARHHGLPPPAAFVGDWYSSVAVLAPSVSLRPVVAVPPPLSPVDGPAGAVGGGWVGYLGYGLTDPVPRPRLLPGAVAGWADHV